LEGNCHANHPLHLNVVLQAVTALRVLRFAALLVAGTGGLGRRCFIDRYRPDSLAGHCAHRTCRHPHHARAAGGDCQLLGAYYETYLNAAKTRVGRGPVNIQIPGLVIQMSGHQRAFYGRAYLVDRVPQGLSTDEIR
jgi:hypothetical protein